MDAEAGAAAFDENWYLRAYPDIAEAVAKGSLASGRDHYMRLGREEGRKPASQFDGAWYASHYPLAREEAGAEDAEALERHYLEVGRRRGYLPERNGDRLIHSAGKNSKFGGLWIDMPNAIDIAYGRYDLGVINRADRDNLERFITDGYVVLPNTLPPAILDRADQALEKAFSGEFPLMLFESRTLSPGHMTWAEGVRRYAAKALDIHWYADQVRDAIFCEPISHFLGLIFERPAMASQTLGFYRGSGQPLHQDSAYVAYSQPLHFAASWIALEDVQPGAGELEYLVGSHRALPEFLYPGEVKSVSEAQRLRFPWERISGEIGKHEQSLQDQERALGLKRLKFNAKRGDALIWHADLAHGGAKISQEHTRKSLVTHYCPHEVAPLFFETGERKTIVRHDTHNYYTSGIYA